MPENKSRKTNEGENASEIDETKKNILHHLLAFLYGLYTISICMHIGSHA